MRPWIAGQKRFSLRFSQMAQLTIETPESLSHAECTWPERGPDGLHICCGEPF
jgi:hypothetical protein